MAKTLVIKNSMVPGKVPTNADIQWGELALNIPDKIIYSMDDQGVVVAFTVSPEELSAGLDGKVDKVVGKGLSTNDFTETLLAKLNGISEGAEVNPLTTDSRASNSTTEVLQAKAMYDHVNSGDHDSRYYTKAEIDAMFAALGN
jgi:hypothetical protein